ncbi:MAG: ATP-binding cassette domain-containing protein, partial [Rhodococcus sp. (in: high G+C Gram-positive bacteria)]
PKDRDIAMVFQSYALYPHMTVRQNIAFPLTLAKLSKSEINEKVEDAARILDLSQHLDRKPANLSGGQRQRVAMGRAIVRTPKAFLMDEPLSNLDAKLRVQTRAEISRLQKRLGTTTVYVTHDQTEAMTLGDRVVVLRGGLVQQIGSPQELYDKPRNLFVGGFIGSPSMNFVPGTLTADGIKTDLGTFELPRERRASIQQKNPGSEVVVGIRPEHFEDAALIDYSQKINGATFTARVDVLESMGSDKYVYFASKGDKVQSAELQELAADAGLGDVGSAQVVARLAAESKAAEGSDVELWFDPAKVSVFDQSSGANLTL